MENRVGDNVPSAQKLKDLLKKLQEVIAEMQAFGVVLSAEERVSLVHPRKGAAPHMQRVYELAKKHGINVPDIPLDGMQNDLGLGQAIQPFADAFRLGLQLSEDTLAQASTEGWQAFLAYYGVLGSLSARHPEIAAGLAPVVEFMRTVRRKQPEKPPQGVLPTAAKPDAPPDR